MDEERENRWHTCKHCGYDDRTKTDRYNFVMDGCCRKCRTRISREVEFKNSDGSCKRDDEIMCPYCGYVEEDDCYESNNSKSWDCPECGKTADLDVEYTTHYRTTKRD